ncbi:helix-turn-helix domain-containing protein [Microbacterium lacticum]
MATDDVSLVGRRLQTVRSAHRLSAAELAARVPGGAVSKTVITNVESGRKRDLTVTELLLLAHALDVPPLFLVIDPRLPWEKVDIPGIDMTNIEYARRSDLFEGEGSAFWGGPYAAERGLISGEEALLEFESAIDELKSGEVRPGSDPELRAQHAISRLASAVDTLERQIARDENRPSEERRLDSPVVTDRYSRLVRELEQLKASYPEFHYRPHVIWGRAPQPSVESESNHSGSAADAAE